MSEPEPAMAIERSLLFVLSRSGRIARSAAADALAEEGLRLDHLAALAVLVEEDGGVAQRRLGERLAKDPGDVVRLVDDLEDRGWAVRRRDPGDRRRSLVAATTAGEEALGRGLRAVEAAEDEALHRLSATERTRLRDVLDRVGRSG